MALSDSVNLRYWPLPLHGTDKVTADYITKELRTMAERINLLLSGQHESLWQDNTGDIATAKGTATAPTWNTFGPSGVVNAYEFNRGDGVILTYHIKHDVEPGTTIYPHVHWSTDGTGSGDVEWVLTYIVAKGHQQEEFAAGSTSPITLVQTANANAWHHHIVEGTSASQGIPMPEVDSLLILKVERGSTSDTYSNTASGHVFGLMVDLHYKANRIGTINKAPDFYKKDQ